MQQNETNPWQSDGPLDAGRWIPLVTLAIEGFGTGLIENGLRNCQYLWIGLFQATSVPVDSVGAESADGVMSVGRSSSLPLWKIAPARTRATRCGALTARQRACAASISL